MPPTAITVRPLATPNEIATFGRLTVETFFHVPDEAAESVAAGWVSYLEQGPRFVPEQRRGAFRDGRYLGGYLIQERLLRMGAATIPTGCIGSVVTVPEFRRQGVATALLEDALNFAHVRHLGLLLLDGIPDFYARFGYADVVDLTVQVIDRAAIQAQPASPISVRSATHYDAPALLALYNRHYGPYTGSFVRTLTEQERQLEIRGHDNAPLVAVAADGTLAGYLYFGWGGDRAFALEAAAESWPATLALLQRQAQLIDTEATAAEPATVRWRLPRTAPTAYLLADNLAVPDTTAWGEPSYGWSVRSESYTHPNAGWMARTASIAGLIRATLPEWQAHLAQNPSVWHGKFALVIGEETFAFDLSEMGLERIEQTTGDSLVARLSPQIFMQLLFGYRPVRWAARQQEQHLPQPLLPLLAALFPPEHAYIPGTDDF
jgi:predicted N-acetyltransferase YhbS